MQIAGNAAYVCKKSVKREKASQALCRNLVSTSKVMPGSSNLLWYRTIAANVCLVVKMALLVWMQNAQQDHLTLSMMYLASWHIDIVTCLPFSCQTAVTQMLGCCRMQVLSPNQCSYPRCSRIGWWNMVLPSLLIYYKSPHMSPTLPSFRMKYRLGRDSRSWLIFFAFPLTQIYPDLFCSLLFYSVLQLTLHWTWIAVVAQQS